MNTNCRRTLVTSAQKEDFITVDLTTLVMDWLGTTPDDGIDDSQCKLRNKSMKLA